LALQSRACSFTEGIHVCPFTSALCIKERDELHGTTDLSAAVCGCERFKDEYELRVVESKWLKKVCETR
jgi:hypothetical protein